MGLFCLGTAAFLEGCRGMLLFDPKGPIGEAERFVVLTAVALMLIVVIPVIVMVFWFPFRYRAANTGAVYRPQWSRSKRIELTMWLIPAAIVTALAVLIWGFTHRLDPYKPIESNLAPIRIEVVSLDWKWLFIYPDQQIASVNELVFPAGAPLNFRLTSASVMTSFFIPQLGSQIYAMAGMETRLHLMADEPGVYAGQNQQFSGRGYADMTFTARSATRGEFAAWVRKVRQAPDRLDPVRYGALARPSVGRAVMHFSAVTPGLFEQIVGSQKPLGTAVPKISAAEEN